MIYYLFIKWKKLIEKSASYSTVAEMEDEIVWFFIKPLVIFQSIVFTIVQPEIEWLFFWFKFLQLDSLFQYYPFLFLILSIIYAKLPSR